MTYHAKHKRRVVVTAMGAVTPAGHTMEETWNGIIEGVSVADQVSRFDASQMPTQIAYEIRDFKLPEGIVTEDEKNLLNHASTYGVAAAAEALEASGLKGADLNRQRMAVCLGSGMGSPEFDWFANIYSQHNVNDPSVKYLPKNFPNTFTAIVERMFGAHGGSATVHTACASSGQSLGEAFEMIAYGERDVVITGGADSMINPFHTAGFCLLGALSKRNDDPKVASRPFDNERDGFVLGEGACVLVFEELEHAIARGAKILGEVAGYGITESAYRITDLHPEGHGPIEAMAMAVEDAGIRPQEVGYINAHGTSTLLNDRIESLAVSKVFQDCPELRVSSTKSVTGHMISAAGAIEFAVCLQALRHQVLPPSTNLFEKDPQCPVRLTDRRPQDADLHYALSNSVGFGGSNTALIAKRYA